MNYVVVFPCLLVVVVCVLGLLCIDYKTQLIEKDLKIKNINNRYKNLSKTNDILNQRINVFHDVLSQEILSLDDKLIKDS